ncbi:MAG: hypothetical protein HRT88_10610 [Lentisphaeraceae bacterium]|nr:hypothetical protein [Lentisphaeraceae bacterium]
MKYAITQKAISTINNQASKYTGGRKEMCTELNINYLTATKITTGKTSHLHEKTYQSLCEKISGFYNAMIENKTGPISTKLIRDLLLENEGVHSCSKFGGGIYYNCPSNAELCFESEEYKFFGKNFTPATPERYDNSRTYHLLLEKNGLMTSQKHIGYTPYEMEFKLIHSPLAVLKKNQNFYAYQCEQKAKLLGIVNFHINNSQHLEDFVTIDTQQQFLLKNCELFTINKAHKRSESDLVIPHAELSIPYSYYANIYEVTRVWDTNLFVKSFGEHRYI